ncbi:hypothetical protein [Rubrimonas cliftonensis]|uniref:Uncharacterized protein n=1 Tax=Rubrimonas cliftonensis TaxID=89524 RepID=A0A1H4FG50_9RHOB|nr:hypothetical protein [Rubrimonas cliftonensis]SEA96329.1 hypothetical protein SAMN05444370_12212 [Rubrimonas cliftonensis]
MSVQSDRPGLVAELFAIAVADALVAVDLSLGEWVAVLEAHNGGFSGRRAWFEESARMQLRLLAQGVHDDAPNDNLNLARRIDALPTLQSIAIMDVVDRFWTPSGIVEGGMQGLLESLGVVFSRTGHARLRRAAALV